MNREEKNRLIAEEKKKDTTLKQLFDAVNKNDLEKVKSVCEKNKSIVQGIINKKKLINGKYRSLLECAANDKITEYLILQGADLSVAITDAIQRKDLKAVKSICEKNQPIVQRTLKEKPGPLEAATLDNTYNSEIIKYLAQQGADPNAVDNQKRFLLHLRIAEGHFKGARALVKMGADVNAKNQEENSWHMTGKDGNALNGDTSLHFAIRAYNNNKVTKPEKAQQALEFIKLLIERGADLSAQNRTGRTPLSLADFHGSLAVSRLIIKHMLFQDFNTEMPKIINYNVELLNYWNGCKAEAVKLHDRVGDKIDLTSGDISIRPVMRTLSQFLDHGSRKNLIEASLKFDDNVNTGDTKHKSLNLSSRQWAVIGIATVTCALALALTLYFLPLILCANVGLGTKLALGAAGAVICGGVGYLGTCL